MPDIPIVYCKGKTAKENVMKTMHPVFYALLRKNELPFRVCS